MENLPTLIYPTNITNGLLKCFNTFMEYQQLVNYVLHVRYVFT